MTLLAALERLKDFNSSVFNKAGYFFFSKFLLLVSSFHLFKIDHVRMAERNEIPHSHAKHSSVTAGKALLNPYQSILNPYSIRPADILNVYFSCKK